MTHIKFYQVDAFTDRLFAGNPAAVCMLDDWLPDALMQQIAMEHNLSETAFIVPMGNDFGIRWFTPVMEVDLCGHATLAAGYVLFTQYHYADVEIRFHSLHHGLLKVQREEDLYYLDFPADRIHSSKSAPEILTKCLGINPREIYMGKSDLIAVLQNEKEVRNLQPDFTEMRKLDVRGLIVTSAGEHVDFVSRFFAPQAGIDEDPVTGSAHTTLIPLWQDKLGKNKFKAQQVSRRGGYLECELKGDRCLIGGNAVLYSTGDIHIG